jgi:hypothetical protein
MYLFSWLILHKTTLLFVGKKEIQEFQQQQKSAHKYAHMLLLCKKEQKCNYE